MSIGIHPGTLSVRRIFGRQRPQDRIEVDAGLKASQKWLPTRLLYDQTGSELFEAITELPEYYLTRSEAEIFERYAEEIVAEAKPRTLIEFGSGSSTKTRWLLDASRVPLYVPIDISGAFLRQTSTDLIERYPGLAVTAVEGEYFDVAEELPVTPGPRLILFLGSNIGNLERAAAIKFLSLLNARMSLEDRVLVGVDLVKDPGVIEAAYNDSLGITAQFNKNLLKRINRDMGGNFDLACFRHRAPYIAQENRVEMRLYAIGDQRVEIQGTGKSYTFRDGEFIHTEWSHKYTLNGFSELAARAGLKMNRYWTDSKGYFAATLLSKK